MSQELCVPCKEKGLVVLAHYQGIPAGKSHTGKAIPAQCYYHHFNMPLPKTIDSSTSLVDGGPPAEPEKVKEEMTPTPEQPAERICSRPGCGKKLGDNNTSGRCGNHFYIPKREKTGNESPAKPKRKVLNGPGMASTIIQVTESRLDAWWNNRTAEQKGEIFARSLEL